jgi:hypothetical protein
VQHDELRTGYAELLHELVRVQVDGAHDPPQGDEHRRRGVRYFLARYSARHVQVGEERLGCSD